jgi:hypothetical protein
MSSKDEELDWLRQHLSYEVEMLRYTMERAASFEKPCPDYHVYYESFAVHARLLKEFLCNDGGGGNFQAKNFVAKFKPTRLNDFHGPFATLNNQGFHPGKCRPATGDGKFNSDDCWRVYEWLEAQMARFQASLDEPYRSEWLERLDAMLQPVSKIDRPSPPTVTINFSTSPRASGEIKMTTVSTSANVRNFVK